MSGCYRNPVDDVSCLHPPLRVIAGHNAMRAELHASELRIGQGRDVPWHSHPVGRETLGGLGLRPDVRGISGFTAGGVAAQLGCFCMVLFFMDESVRLGAGNH